MAYRTGIKPEIHIKPIQYRLRGIGLSLSVKSRQHRDDLIVAYTALLYKLIVAAHDIGAVIAEIYDPVEHILTVVTAVQRDVEHMKPSLWL